MRQGGKGYLRHFKHYFVPTISKTPYSNRCIGETELNILVWICEDLGMKGQIGENKIMGDKLVSVAVQVNKYEDVFVTNRLCTETNKIIIYK